MRRRHSAGISYGKLAAQYDVSRQWVIMVVKDRAWKTGKTEVKRGSSWRTVASIVSEG
jgi:hypothetical protein